MPRAAGKPLSLHPHEIAPVHEGMQTQVRRVVSPTTCEVLGSRVTVKSPAWTGIKLDRAVAREKCPLTGVARPHLGVPWVHPEDEARGMEADAIYRVDPIWEVDDRLWVVQIRPIDFGAGKYGVGDDGKVYNIAGVNPKICRTHLGPKGYEEITLRHQGQQKACRVNRLVAEAFYGPPPSPNHVCRHLDNQRRNNDPLNLDWGTAAQNSADASAAGSFSGQKASQSRLSDAEVAAIRASTEPQAVLAMRYDVTQPTISKIRSGKRWRSEHPSAPPPNLPRTHQRLTLIVEAVRVERLQDIKGVDTIAEGIACETCTAMGRSACNRRGCFESMGLFRERWDKTHRAGELWADNPWVVVLTVAPVPAEDAVGRDALPIEEAAHGR